MLKKICISAVVAVTVALSANAQTSALERQKKAIQGTYLVSLSGFPNAQEVVYEYARYVIYGNTFTEYSWDELRKVWVVEYSVPYKLVYRRNADYMTGYNIVINHPDGYVMRMCTGDVNGDGKMDLWSSDSLFYTKQKSKQ